MAFICSSRTWATRRTTTTSRKLLRCSSKILRWKQMYLLLRADQRLKQNNKDPLLPAHPQELYPSGKESGLMLSQNIIRQSLTQCQNKWILSFVMVIYLEKTMEFWRLKEYLRNDFMQFQHWSDEKWKGKMAKCGGNEHISILYWTRHSLSPSHSRSFRTQPHWSFITGQCINLERFLRVHLSHRMCDQFTLHHEFRIDTRRTKFEQKTDGILHICGSYEQGTQRSRCNWLGCTASC